MFLAEFESLIGHDVQSLIPGFPQDMYPAEFEGLIDHDVQTMGIRIPDFQVCVQTKGLRASTADRTMLQRVALRFPFVDRLNDGYSCFRYTAPQLITATNLIALGGSTMYGKTLPGTFEPSCDAYASEDGDMSTTYLKAYLALFGAEPKFDTSFATVDSIPYDLKLCVPFHLDDVLLNADALQLHQHHKPALLRLWPGRL
jgi:hypothetical protein